MSEKLDLRDCSKEELKRVFAGYGQAPYHAIQAFRWLQKEGSRHIDDMKNLSLALRTELKKKFHISSLRLLDEKLSPLDGTTKYLLELEDRHAIETVYLPEDGRATVCVSSQVGCKRACAFCASSVLGLVRNLHPAEIVNEVLYILKERSLPVTNIVFMGIGEPFDNYDNVMKAIRMMNDPDGLNIGARKITISTCGLIPGIEKLSREGIQVELSISLHSADDKTRSRIVPVNKKYPVKDLIASCRDYTGRTNRVVTFEYVLIKDMNCNAADAVKLIKLIEGMKCKVNLISYNQIRSLGLEAPSREEAAAFLRALKAKGVNAMLRKSRGEDIDAGCGQLRISRILGK